MSVVLVVDSRGDVMQSVSDALAEKSGYYAVIICRTGRSAISSLRGGLQVDIAVIDDRLEDMDGIDFVASIKSLAPELPVIISSEQPSVEAYLKAVHAGVFEFMSRPVNPPTLRKIISAALEERGLFRQSHSRPHPIESQQEVPSPQ